MSISDIARGATYVGNELIPSKQLTEMKRNLANSREEENEQCVLLVVGPLPQGPESVNKPSLSQVHLTTPKQRESRHEQLAFVEGENSLDVSDTLVEVVAQVFEWCLN